MNKVIYGAEARGAILEGAKILYNAVKTTYGPKSGNVGLVTERGLASVTHDGATVAKSISLKPPLVAGADVIRKTAIKMDEELGDATTTVVILSYAIIEEANKLIELGESPIRVRDALNKDKGGCLNALDKLAKDTCTKKEMLKVAITSAGDKEIGEIAAKAVSKTGEKGIVSVEEGTTLETKIEYADGYSFDSGYLAPHFINDIRNQEVLLQNPEIEIVDEITTTEEALPHIRKAKDNPLLLIVNKIEPEVLNRFVEARVEAGIDIAVVNKPGYGNTQDEVIKDIEAIKDHAVTARVGRHKTTISHKADITKRLQELDAEIEATPLEYDKINLEARRASLEGKSAIIKVGGSSEVEIGERAYNLEDAVQAAKAAYSGVIPGGGTTPLELSKSLDEKSVLGRALKWPIKVLLENAGFNYDKYKESIKLGQGIDVDDTSGEVIDLVERGILEPKDTMRLALEYAVSIAGTAITIEALVVPEEKDE